jgi:ribosomal protein S18 acetylase RimI-like enzyme
VLDAARVQAALRATAARGRAVEHLPPFMLFLDPRDALRYHNYAIPDGDVEPSAEELEALRAAFRARARLPRLEFVEEAAPRLAPALEAAGMTEELRTPLMACAPASLLDAPAAVDELVIALAGPGDLRELASLQRVAFGQAPLPPDEEAREPRGNGGGAVLARAAGEPVAAAAWTAIVDGLTEIVGVATAESRRGRGLAGAVTAAAARAAFEHGASTCVLTPGNETAQRVYARAGFARLATMLHWSDLERS